MKLSIALALEKEHATRINFRKLLHPSGKKDNAKGQKLFGNLGKLGKTFVTTNYDEWLDEEIGMPAFAVDPKYDPAAPAIINQRKGQRTFKWVIL